MYQIFQKCNRQRQSGDGANVVGGYDEPFRKRYSTSHRPKKNFKRSNQASRIPDHDADNADEFTDDEHIVIDVWPPSSVSAEVTWNRPNVATCSATAHSTGSLSPMYSSACTVEPFDDDHRSQSMEKRERSISPDTRRPSNARCSPNKRGCSDARWFSNVNEWSPCAKGSRNEPPSAVTRWFPMPPDPRCPVARDPHGGRWSQPPPAPVEPPDVRHMPPPFDTREPPDFLWPQSSPSVLPPSLSSLNTGNRGSAAVPPSTFYPAHRQVRNVRWKSGSASHFDRLRKGVLDRKDSLVVLDSTASSSDSDCPQLSRRPLHNRRQRKDLLTESMGNAQQNEKFAKCTADGGSRQSEHHSNLGCVDLSSTSALRSSPQTDGGLENQVSKVDAEQLYGMNKKQNYAPCDKDSSTTPLQAVMPCQDAPPRIKHSARKSTGGGYKKPIDLKSQKFLAFTPDRKGLTSCTLKEPLVVIKKVCTGFSTPVTDASKCDPIVVSSSCFVPSEHPVNAKSKYMPSHNSVVADDPLLSKSVSSDHSFLAEPSIKPVQPVKVGRFSKSVRSGRSAKAKHLAPITDDDSVLAVPPEIVPSDLADCVSPEHSIVADSHQPSSLPPVVVPEPPNVQVPHLASSGSPTVVVACELMPPSLGTDSQQPSSTSLYLTSSTQASTVSVIAGPKQPEPSSGLIGSNLEQIVQHLKRRAEVVVEDSVSTKKRRWNRMPPCSPLADPLPPFPTSRSSARLSKKNKLTCPLNKKDKSTDAPGPLVCEPVTSSSPPFVSEPSTSCKVSVIQGEYAITHINGSPYMDLEDRNNWHLPTDPLHYDMSLEMCMQSPPVGAWTKDAIDAEVQVEAATPAGYDKEELDSYIKAKLDESLAKELNIKLQHMKKQIDMVLQEKERLEKAHKNAIIKIQSLMRTTLKPSVLDKATSTIGLQSTHDLLATDNSTAKSSLIKIRKRNIGVQCEMMLSKQRKRTCGVQTEGLVAFEVLNCSYVDKQKGMISATNTAPSSTRNCQAEGLTVEPLCIDDGVSVPEPEVSTSKSATAVHKWLATENKNSCARCIRVNPKLSTSFCARSRAHFVTSQPTSGNPLHRPPTGGIMKALWKLQLFLTKLPVHQLFLDRFTSMMANFVDCTSSIFQGEVEPKLAEPVLQILEQCNEVPGLATYLLGQKLQELCNLLVRLRKLRSYLTQELSRGIETLYRQTSDTLNLVVSPQHHKDDDPYVGSISCSIVSSPCGSDMESDCSADDMDFSHESSESNSSESESCTQESSARTTGGIHAKASVSRSAENSCAITRAPVEENELRCSSTGDATVSPTMNDSSTVKFVGSTIDSSIGPCRRSSGDTCSYQTLHSMERAKNIINGDVMDSVSNRDKESLCVGDQLNDMIKVIQQRPVHQASQSPSAQSISPPDPSRTTIANPDKLNTLLTQLCKQLNNTHQRMVTNKGTAASSRNPSTAPVPTVMSTPCIIALIPHLLPLVNNSISIATNLASTSIETTTTIGTSAYATSGVKVTACVTPSSLPPYSSVKATLCNTNDANGIASAVSVLTKAVVSHSTVAQAVNEIFSKTQLIQQGKIRTKASPLSSLLSKNNPKSSPHSQTQSDQSAASLEPPAKSPTFQSLTVVPPKSGSQFHSSCQVGGNLPVNNISPTGGLTKTVEILAQVCDNQCVGSLENSVTHTSAIDTSTLLSQRSPEGQQNSMLVSASVKCPANVNTSKTVSNAEKCEQNFSQMPVLSTEFSKTVDTSDILPETSEKTQEFSQLPLLSVAQCIKTVETSKVLLETSSAAEKCQQNVSMLPVSSSVEQSKAVTMPEILNNSSEIFTTATKCQQNSTVSSVIEQSKTVDMSKILLHSPFAAEQQQQGSSSVLVASTVEHSQTAQMPETLAIAEKCCQSSTTMQTSSIVEHSNEVETTRQSFQTVSFAERYQHCLSTTSIASQNVSETKMPSKPLPSITLPLAAPLVSPSTANKFVRQGKSPTTPVTVSKVQGCVSKTSALLTTATSISASQTATYISASQMATCVSASQTGPCISVSQTGPCISASQTAPCVSASPLLLPVSNSSAYHQPSTISVTRDSCEQSMSQLPKAVSFPTSASFKLFATLMPEGIVIKWTFVEEFLSCENQVMNYELFVLVGKEHQMSSKALSWILLGKILPLPLPMAVTLTNYAQGESYTFLVKAIFKNCARHVYSNPGKVQL